MPTNIQSAVPHGPEGVGKIAAHGAHHQGHLSVAEVEGLPCPTSLRIGDMVLLSTRYARIACRSTFTPTYLGPFAITLVNTANETCKLALPPHSNVADDYFHSSQLRMHSCSPTAISSGWSTSSSEADEVTPDINIDTGYAGRLNFYRSMTTSSEAAEASHAIRDVTTFSTLEILGLPRPQRDEETAGAKNPLEEHAKPFSSLEIMGLTRPARQEEHWCDLLKRLERELPEAEEIQAPDQRVLAAFQALLDIE